MFKKLKISTKIYLLAGVILVLMAAIMFWGIAGLSTTVGNGKVKAESDKLHRDLLSLEIDHLEWAKHISNFIIDETINEFDVQTDHTQCALGKWLYGDGRKHAETQIPELADNLRALEESHKLFHESVRRIEAEYQTTAHNLPGQEKNLNIYTQETERHLKDVRDLLHKLIRTTSANTIPDSQMIGATVRTMVGIISIGTVALVLGVGLAFFISRAITVPVRNSVLLANQIAKGDLGHRLNLVGRTDEVGELGTALDRMADNLSIHVDLAETIARGDLTRDVRVASEKDQLGAALNVMLANLREMVGGIQVAGEQIASGSRQVSEASQSLSQGATESASFLEELTASMHEMADQVRTNAENAGTANQLSGETKQTAENGDRRMTEMVAAMDEINQASQDISKIIKVIDEIAFQTNLLALNAAVEAARAGQHGKGFAVVAEEVRNLAARSAKAAVETAGLIEGSVALTERGAQMAQQTAQALKEIMAGTNKVADLLEEIAAASNKQAQGIGQVTSGLSQIDQVTQQNTASAEESAAAAEQLSGQAYLLREMLTRFTLNRTNSAPVQIVNKATGIPDNWGYAQLSTPKNGKTWPAGVMKTKRGGKF